MNFDDLPESIQHVLVNMCFNLGFGQIDYLNLETCCMHVQ